MKKVTFEEACSSLCKAIVKQAIRDANSTCVGKKAISERDNTRKWLSKDNTMFKWYCDMAGLDCNKLSWEGGEIERYMKED